MNSISQYIMIMDSITDHDSGNEADSGKINPNMNWAVKEYLLKNSETYQTLYELKSLGWQSNSGDKYFVKRRSLADHADKKLKKIFFSMMCEIGRNLDGITSAWSPNSNSGEGFHVLDICMAPGGMSSSILEVHPNARISAITLPECQNGHKIMLQNWETDPRIQLYFGDVTMLLNEMGGTEIPEGHPDTANFVNDHPFSDQKFDLVICDGQVLRMHQRPEYRENRESWRLLTSQLVVALTRVKNNGTLVILLHKLDRWETLLLVYTLSEFSTIEIYKHEKIHAIKSSFYAVAKNIQASGKKVDAAIEEWKKEWQLATFGSEKEYIDHRRRHDHRAAKILNNFGNKLINLGEPIWMTQSTALRKAPFIKKALKSHKGKSEKQLDEKVQSFAINQIPGKLFDSD